MGRHDDVELPPAGPRIEALYGWIATYPDGSEGVISAALPLPGSLASLGRRVLPLLAASRQTAEMLAPYARQALCAAPAERAVAVQLVTWRRR
jgi:hypothetical protein